jgi:uncharacterized repeat protein (TIGR03803 family)
MVGGTPLLYGRTANGGNSSLCGIFFSTGLSFGSTYQVLHDFSGADGCDPRHDAMVLINGTLYSSTLGQPDSLSTVYNGGTLEALIPGSSTPTAIYTFPASSTSIGLEQHSSVTLDPVTGSWLFGQTAAGGSKDDGQIYALNATTYNYIDLHDLHKSEGDDPHGRIIDLYMPGSTTSTLWGITRHDGSPLSSHQSGFGTIYSLVVTYAGNVPSPQPSVNVVHTFTGAPTDAAFSDHGYLTPVIQGGQTVLYGLTQCGGSGGGSDKSNCKGIGDGDGAIFELTPTVSNGEYTGDANGYTVLRSFQGAPGDGANPYGSLYYDGSTYLYGTTAYGGTYDEGTIFRFMPGQPSSYQVIYNFSGKNGDGAKPIDNVIMYNGILYGMTVYGGTTNTPFDGSKNYTGNGTIFAMPAPTP